MKRATPLPLALLAIAISLGAAACDDDGPTEPAESTSPPSTAVETTEPVASTEPGPTTESPGTTEPGTSSVPAEEPTVASASEVVVGLSQADATAAAEASGWELRVTRQDGEDLPATMDLRPNRINVEITGGVVTAVLTIG